MTIKCSEIVKEFPDLITATQGDLECTIETVASVESAHSNALVFVAQEKYLSSALSRSGAIVAPLLKTHAGRKIPEAANRLQAILRAVSSAQPPIIFALRGPNVPVREELVFPWPGARRGGSRAW